jgi:hypothetical protein
MNVNLVSANAYRHLSGTLVVPPSDLRCVAAAPKCGMIFLIWSMPKMLNGGPMRRISCQLTEGVPW